MHKKAFFVGGVVWLVALSLCGAAAGEGSQVVIYSYTADIDDISEDVKTYGQLLAHSEFDIQLRETVTQVPIFALQYGGYHYKTADRQEPTYVEARAKAIAERLVHAWTLMDHGAVLEVGADDWNAHRMKPKMAQAKQVCIRVRSPIQGYEPLRVMTVYPEDVRSYPWLPDAQSLAEYLIDVLQVHYLLFWKHSGDINRFESLRLDRTREGKIFKEIALRALEVAKLKGNQTYDQDMLKDALARLSLSQRERLHRLATTPPMDWESVKKSDGSN